MAAFNGFNVGDIVTIDGRGSGKIIASATNNNSLVEIIGADAEVTIGNERLQRQPNCNQTETCSARPKQTTNIRFKPVGDTDIDKIIDDQQNKKTAQKTLYDINLFTRFLHSEPINEHRKIQNIPPLELNKIICKFLISVRKIDGGNYEPNSLRGMVASFDRYLKRHKYGYSIISSFEFTQVTDVLKSKQRELKREGKGNLPNKCDSISDEEIEKLWQCHQLGSGSPESILNTLWFFNTVHFGLRGSDEHRDMQWGDIVLGRDHSGLEFLEFNERQTKTRTGDNPRDVRLVKPRVWALASGIMRCPIRIYKVYRELRPANACSSDAPFYLATNTKGTPTAGQQWFKNQPVGVNKLMSLMKRMAAAAGFEKHLTNHSARKHLIQKLNDNNVPHTHIMQISGHRNVNSVTNYSHINEIQHRNISRILSACSSETVHSTITTSNVTQTATAFTRVPPANFHPDTNLAYQSDEQSNQFVFNVSGVHTLFSGPVSGGTFHINVVGKENE